MITNRQLFLNHLAPTSSIPLGLEITHAQGCYMWDADGKKYLDLISGISVSNLGHLHPEVVTAIKEQLEKYTHLMVYGEYVQLPQVKFAEALTSTLPSNLSTVYFTNSGSEATEGAMKLAKRVTGKPNFVSCVNAYHGSTQGSLSLSGNEELKHAFRPLLPGISNVRYNVEEDLGRIDENTAAVFIETIQAEAGVLEASNNFLKAIRKRCNETGALLVVDEIQTGLGRTGRLWAFEEHNIIPDILLLGKALGGGMPLGAFISSSENMQRLSHDPVLGHITTFGGHPVSCAAGLAAFQYVSSGNMIESVNQKWEFFKSMLNENEKLLGKGLLLAYQLKDFSQVQKVISYCMDRGVVTDWFLFNNYSIRIAPPLIISEEDLEFAAKTINAAVEEL